MKEASCIMAVRGTQDEMASRMINREGLMTNYLGDDCGRQIRVYTEKKNLCIKHIYGAQHAYIM